MFCGLIIFISDITQVVLGFGAVHITCGEFVRMKKGLPCVFSQVSSRLLIKTGRPDASPWTTTGTDPMLVSWRTSCWCRRDEETGQLTWNRQAVHSCSHFSPPFSAILSLNDLKNCKWQKDTGSIRFIRRERKLLTICFKKHYTERSPLEAGKVSSRFDALLSPTESTGGPDARPCDIASSICEGRACARRCGGRPQSCLGFRDSLKTYSCCVSRC